MVTKSPSLRPNDAAALLGISKNTLYRWLRLDPTFPRPCRLGPNTTVFDADELLAWRDGKRAA